MRTRLQTALTAGLFFALAAGAVAWACSAQPYIELLPARGEPGTVVTVRGNGFNSGEGIEPVGIHWNSKDGQKLAEVSASSFSVQISIPDVPPGAYTVLAYQPRTRGVLTDATAERQAPAAFEVLARTSSPPPSQGPPSGRNNASQTSSSESGGGTGAGPTRLEETQPQDSTAGPGASSAPAGDAVSSEPSKQSRRGDPGSPVQPQSPEHFPVPAGGSPPKPLGQPMEASSGPGVPSPPIPASVATTDLWSGFGRYKSSPSLTSLPATGVEFGRGPLTVALTVLSAAFAAMLFALGTFFVRSNRQARASRDVG